MDLTNAYAVLRDAIGPVTPAAQLVVRFRGDVVCSEAFGWLDPETRAQPTQCDTLFDMASVSKLFTVVAFMTLVEEGRVALDTPFGAVLPEFGGLRPIQPYEDPLSPGRMVAVSESSGFVDACWITFYDLLTHTSGLPAWRPLYREPSADAAYLMALNTFFSYSPGTQVVYSDIGLILLGMAIERLTEQSLDAAVRTRVTATCCHTDGIGARRGLGFALWLDDPEASSNPFSRRAFGHTGFTGTCLWMDPERDLVVALLTNEVYNGRQNRGIAGLRVAVHRAIVAAL